MNKADSKLGGWLGAARHEHRGCDVNYDVNYSDFCNLLENQGEL